MAMWNWFGKKATDPVLAYPPGDFRAPDLPLVKPPSERLIAPPAVVIKPKKNPKAALHVTLWPAFPHFHRFAADPRINGIRCNSAMMEASEIDENFVSEIEAANVSLWFDIKAMQLRVREVLCGTDCDHLEFRLNRPIKCHTPCPVWFKAGEDCAKLVEIRDGTHLVFDGGPKFEVKTGESIHIRNPELEVGGPVFLDYEKEKIEKVVKLGFSRFYLSYVYDQKHVDEFRELIGADAKVILKIENKWGLQWVADAYKRQPNTFLAAARGDLFIEIDRPDQIMTACKLIIEKDPNAVVGSRMLLSCISQSVPSCADLNELAWLYDVGYRNFLLCDELCLKESLLARAVNVFDAFRREYIQAPSKWGS